jgi:hypothetical protein
VKEMSELAMTESAEALGDITGRRSGRILALIAVFEVSRDVRLRGYFKD